MRGLVDHRALLTLDAAEYIIYFTALHVGLLFSFPLLVIQQNRKGNNENHRDMVCNYSFKM